MSIQRKKSKGKDTDPGGPVIPGSTLHFILQRVARSVAQRLLAHEERRASDRRETERDPPTDISPDH